MLDIQKRNGLSRRGFLSRMTFLVGGTLYLSGCGPAKSAKKWRVLTDAEAELVEAITSQIIPTDQDPGAREAGCVNFIDKQLAGFYSEHLPLYRRGLVGVNQTSQAMYAKAFLALSWEDQTSVLKRLETGKAQGQTWQEDSSRQFFRLIRDHTMQGFYGSPRHGGNRNYVSYRMMGLDYPQIVGQNRYENG